MAGNGNKPFAWQASDKGFIISGMKKNQLTQGLARRVMYVENKDGEIDGIPGRIGWVTFSKTGLSVYYRGRTLRRSKGRPVNGNFYDAETKETYWVSGIKKRGSNQHWAESIKVQVDDDAREEYNRLKSVQA
jgi:hypothetical protein